MLDGNVLLRQKRDEVPEGTLSCPDRNLAVFHHYRRYVGLRLLPSVCEQKIIQQTLFNYLLLDRSIHSFFDTSDLVPGGYQSPFVILSTLSLVALLCSQKNEIQ